VRNANNESTTEQQGENQPPLTANTKQSEIQDAAKAGWKKYINTTARFSVEYPEKLQVFETLDNNGGRVSLCTQDPKSSSSGDCSEGVVVSYALPFIDGKGGGCPQEDHKTFTILGVEENVCLGKNYLSLLYVPHPEKISEVSIWSKFEQEFTEQEMRSVLSTFTFLE